MTLLRQIDELDADVVCLEELSDYWTFFKPELSERGYDSVYVKRPSIHVSNWSGEKKQDGCGIFYKKEKLELVECESINFHDSHDRVALLALLRCRKYSQLVLIGCTHLWWNAKKVGHQMAELFELEEEIVRMCSDIQVKYVDEIRKSVTGPAKFPVILCGDFNNSPQSAIYDYMHNYFLQRPNIENYNEQFRSAYAYYKYNTNESNELQLPIGSLEPNHTTVNYRRCWTIDYIWYSSSNLVPVKTYRVPSEDILRMEDGPEGWHRKVMESDEPLAGKKHNGIPNAQFGSDHVPLLVELEFLK